jgi:acetoin utilization protein AcuC
MPSKPDLRVYLGDSLAAYNFGPTHPFGPERYPAFVEAFEARGLDARTQRGTPARAMRSAIEWFHTPEYVDLVMTGSKTGRGYLDWGDTPAFFGVYEAATTVVGTVLAGVDAVMAGDCRAAFVPIAGLHHASRKGASGFCVFNDCGVAIEYLRRQYKVQRVAYVDIDAHHGDGVFYGFESDPDVCIVDFHQSGETLFPGTGYAFETGEGAAEGTKLNVPLPPGAGDAEFFARWPEALAFIEAAEPEFLIMQCGADGLAEDPLTQLQYSSEVHRRVVTDLRALAERQARGRIIATGGGGYHLPNIAAAWCEVVEALA